MPHRPLRQPLPGTAGLAEATCSPWRNAASAAWKLALRSAMFALMRSSISVERKDYQRQHRHHQQQDEHDDQRDAALAVAGGIEGMRVMSVGSAR
jgi:hypothetical protein